MSTDLPEPVSPVITANNGVEPRFRTVCSNSPQFCNSNDSIKAALRETERINEGAMTGDCTLHVSRIVIDL